VDSVSRGEQVESELDMFIARRDEKRRRDEGDRSVEEVWAESCRRHDETRRQQNRAACTATSWTAPTRPKGWRQR
jgi:hypothetical protein